MNVWRRFLTSLKLDYRWIRNRISSQTPSAPANSKNSWRFLFSGLDCTTEPHIEGVFVYADAPRADAQVWSPFAESEFSFRTVQGKREGKETGPRTSPPKPTKWRLLSSKSCHFPCTIPAKPGPRPPLSFAFSPPQDITCFALAAVSTSAPRRFHGLPQPLAEPSMAAADYCTALRRKLPQRRLPITVESTDTRPFNSRENSDHLARSLLRAVWLSGFPQGVEGTAAHPEIAGKAEVAELRWCFELTLRSSSVAYVIRHWAALHIVPWMGVSEL